MIPLRSLPTLLCALLVAENAQQCENGGAFDGLSCICGKDFMGDRCQFRKCVYGTLLENNRCICQPNYTGVSCDQITRCVHGVVSSAKNDYSCLCPTGWTGKFCQFILCQNGVPNTDEDKCICNHGYMGQFCETVNTRLEQQKSKYNTIGFIVLGVFFVLFSPLVVCLFRCKLSNERARSENRGTFVTQSEQEDSPSIPLSYKYVDNV